MAQSPFRTAVAVSCVVVAAAVIALSTASPWPWLTALVGGLLAIVAMRVPRPPVVARRQPDPGAPPSDPGRIVTAIGEAIADPMLVTIDGRIVVANPAAQMLLGRHIVGEDVRLAIRHPAAADRLANPAGGNPVDLVGLGKGDQHWELHASPIVDGYRAIHLIDRTARYAADRMRVDFVANASHELKTPLASLVGYIETLNDAAAGNDAALRERFLAIMAGEARRMQQLVEDLISLSRIEAEKYRLPAAQIDLAQLIQAVVAQIANGGDPRARDIVVTAAPDVPAVNGDRSQLSQLLHNLIGNAMKYGRAGTPVEVGLVSADETMARLTVADRGEGIAVEHIPRLTERFYRVDPGRSRAVGGTGLGLAIVKHIIERHRGQLDIASAIGRGTTVTVLLPLHSAPALSSKSHSMVTRRLATPIPRRASAERRDREPET